MMKKLLAISNQLSDNSNQLSAFSYQLLAILIIIFFFGCKAKEQPKPEATAPAPVQQVAKAVAPEAEKKESSAVTANQPPRVTAVDATPSYPKIGEPFKVTATATDPDGDEITFEYQWFKNNELLSEKSDTLTLKEFKRGDQIQVNIIPSDGKTTGSMGMIKVTIGNSPPEITSTAGEGRYEDRKFIYQVKAKDPEGDPITFSLKTAPKGMAIDSKTGLITWNVPVDFKGRASVEVNAADDHGGGAVQSFSFELKP